MFSLMLFSLILDSDNTYEPLLKENLNKEIYIDAPSEDWKNDNVYKCPMQFKTKTMIILNDLEAELVEQNTKH